ncbi:MAG TPA: hypothetical protein PKE07_00725 [Lacibacter sp.]|nr:hypothetical protein [Lacibacter sp.]HMO88178.1 hypothetical protein [Lacibacter sp.]
MNKIMLAALLLVGIYTSCTKRNTKEPDLEIKPPPAVLGLSGFYKKYLDADGIPVISSANVSDEALRRARAIVRIMLKNIPAEKQKMIENKLRVGIIGINEQPTHMPEYNDLYTAFPGIDWNNRARAYGATLQRPLTTNCEENMLCMQNIDRYKGEEILTHEFAHAIHELGIRFTNPGFDNELLAAFNNAMAKGLWNNTYAISDPREYWAEGIQCWFNCNLESIPSNGIHNEINTKTELQTYDPVLYNLIKRYFTDENRKNGCY